VAGVRPGSFERLDAESAFAIRVHDQLAVRIIEVVPGVD
jgi:hypothetical protein